MYSFPYLFKGRLYSRWQRLRVARLFYGLPACLPACLPDWLALGVSKVPFDRMNGVTNRFGSTSLVSEPASLVLIKSLITSIEPYM